MADHPGALLRRLRKQAGFTQEQLAERSGVSVSTIRRLENGRAGDHRMTTLNLLLDTLGAAPEHRRQLVDAPATAAPQHTAGPPPSQNPAPPGPPPVEAALATAADALAREVRRRWRREEEQRRVHDPFPLPVRWRDAPADLTDHQVNVQRLPPGAEPPEIDLSGEVGGVAETYRRLPSGRLLILGRAGSGKSVLAVRFALDLLAVRAPAGRVPVILGVGSWDPTATTPRDLLVDGLLRDHPHLARRAPGGSTLAADLVDADLVLPVLDGFDELAESLRGEALRALNTTSMPLVMTSRRHEYARAVREAHTPLVAAGGIELTDLTLDDLADYLPRTARPVAGGRGDPPGVWDAVVDTLRAGGTAGSAHLGSVLRTPLMVILARTMFSDSPGRDPAELLDTARFPTESDVEEYLLAGFLQAVYRRHAPDRGEGGPTGRHRDPERAERWLGYLADTLARRAYGGQDLAWWRIAESLRRPARILNVALSAALCVAVAAWLVGWAASSFFAAYQLPVVLLQGVLAGLTAGAAFGTVYGVVAARSGGVFEPAYVRLRLPAAGRRFGGRRVRAFGGRFAVVLMGGFVMGIGHAWAVTLVRVLYFDSSFSTPGVITSTLVNMLVFGLVLGTAAGLVFGLLAALEAPMDTTAAATPTRLLSSNRSTVARQLLVLVPMLTLGIALAGQVTVATLQGVLGPLVWGPEGLVVGAIGGLGGGLSYVLAFTAWGQWLTLARIWLPLSGALPWDLVAFLDDAYRRGVLRRTGAVYQFRHIRLQQHLAQAHRRRRQAAGRGSPAAPRPRPRRGADDRAAPVPPRPAA